ncbi:methyl-accepting chemotaxis protein [Vreelandella venusta]|uniref:methyl-accepting chemotaxis protein n=1 Tax=Vreelandella venusta TaxID=44935 RepID=UPI00384D00F5
MSSLIHNLSIKKTLTIVMATLVLFMLLLSALSIVINKNGSHALHEIADVGVRQMNAINRSEANLTQANASTREYLKAWEDGEPASEMNRWKLETETYLASAQQRIEEFNTIISPPESEREALAAETNQIYQAYASQLSRVLQADSLSAAQSAWLPIMTTRRDFQTSVRNFVNLAEARTQEVLLQDEDNSQISLYATILIVGFALLMVILARLVIVKAIIQPINNTVTYLTAIANGDLTQHIQRLGRNEIGTLLSGLQDMQSQLTSIVQSLKLNSDNLFTGTNEISIGTQDLSSRTEEQASALQETAASLDELTATVKMNADNAAEANKITSSAAKTAHTSAEESEQMLAMMRELEDNATKMGEIVGIIDGIAFQTNLLALNASVEAARAGEQGRGFAVVANEVRQLASRSSQSASQIRSMLEISRTKTVECSGQAQKSGTTIRELADNVSKVSALMAEITQASEEQSRGIDQVNIAISQIDSVTQQNAALVEESSTAAASLEDQAKQLAEITSQFTVATYAPARQEPLAPPASYAPATTPARKAKREAEALELDWQTF